MKLASWLEKFHYRMFIHTLLRRRGGRRRAGIGPIPTRAVSAELLERRDLLTPFTLTNGTTVASGGTAGDATEILLPYFLNTFEVDGTDHLFQNDLFVRVGPSGGEQLLSELTISNETITGPTADVTYTDGANFDLRLITTLTGPRRIDQSATITNISGDPLELHVFDYYDWDLDQTTLNQFVVNSASNFEQQRGATFAQVAAAPVPDHYQVLVFPSLRRFLEDGSPATLDDTPAIGTQLGTTDHTFAFQWDFTIPAGESTNFLVATGINEPVTLDEPIAISSIAPDVTDAEAGQTSYDITVTYSDDSGIDVSTIDPSDVTITGPGGTPLTVTSAVPDSATNGTPRTVTYSVMPPGGSWRPVDNGTYTIAINADEVGDLDTPQQYVAADASLTTFDVTVTAHHPVCDEHGILDLPGRVPGNILAIVAGPHLLLYPDFRDNAFEVTADEAGKVIVSPLADSTVNGLAAPFIAFTGTDGEVPGVLHVSPSIGNDFVCLHNVAVGGQTVVSTSLGEDAVSVVNVDIGGQLVVDTSAGDGFVDIAGSQVAGPATVVGLTGDDAVDVRDTSFDSTLTIVSTLGNDRITGDNIDVALNVVVNSGPDDDIIDFNDLQAGAAVVFQPGTGDDAVRLMNSEVAGLLHIVPPTGNNVVDLDSNVINGPAVISTDVGHLVLRLRDNTFNSTATLLGGVFGDDILLDDGSSTFAFPPLTLRFDDVSNDLIDEAFEELLELAFG